MRLRGNLHEHTLLQVITPLRLSHTIRAAPEYIQKAARQAVKDAHAQGLCWLSGHDYAEFQERSFRH